MPGSPCGYIGDEREREREREREIHSEVKSNDATGYVYSLRNACENRFLAIYYIISF